MPFKQKPICNEENGELSEHLCRLARNEIREEQLNRKQCLEQMRQWMAKNHDIRDMREDDSFLLRFLRAKKFSVTTAQQMLLKYLNIRRVFPHMSTQLDYLEPNLNNILRNGYIFASPQRDCHGRRAVIINAKSFNAKQYTSADQARAHFLTYECLMEDPETQIFGLLHVGDFSGVTTAHVTNWNPTEFARLFKWSEQSLPLRHKEIHLVNVPTTLRWLIDFIKNRVSTKIKNRLKVYTNASDLIKCVDRSCLPREMGGEMPMKQMLELWLDEVSAKRKVLLSLDNMQLLSDRGIQHCSSFTAGKSANRTNFVSQLETMEGCFRKLDFD